jgi:uncharacterized protein
MVKDGFGPGDDFTAIDPTARYMARLLWDGLTPAQIEAKYPDLKGILESAAGETIFGRHARFFQQLARIDLPATWAKVSEPVLSMHGEFDWVSSREDHERLVQWLESKSSGRARFVALPKLDHGFMAHASLEESYQRFPRGEGDLNPAVAQTLLSWIEKRSAGSAGTS